jgi:hypothetical protein
MIAIKTEMKRMPAGCKLCECYSYSFAEEVFICKELFEHIYEPNKRLEDCPLIEIKESE